MARNIEDYGAIPGGPDAHAAFIAALAFGEDVYVPPKPFSTSPIDIPSYLTRRRIFGEGDASQLTALGGPIFKYSGQGYFGHTIERLRLTGANLSNVPAIDCSPASSAYLCAGTIARAIKIEAFLVGWKLKAAQLCRWEDIFFSFFVSGGKAFWVAPDAGSGQQCNSNNVDYCQFAGPDAEVIHCDFSASASDRAAQWAFKRPIVQFTGSTVTPLTIPDSGWIVENGQFENYTGANLITLHADDVRAPSFTRIIGNLLGGGGSNGAGKMRSESVGAQQSYYVTIENNDSGGPSVPLLEFGPGQSGRSFDVSNNQGSIVGRGGGYHVIRGGSAMLGAIEVNGVMIT